MSASYQNNDPKKTPLDSLNAASDERTRAFGGVAFVYMIDEKP
jgi:hypothetical protein